MEEAQGKEGCRLECQRNRESPDEIVKYVEIAMERLTLWTKVCNIDMIGEKHLCFKFK